MEQLGRFVTLAAASLVLFACAPAPVRAPPVPPPPPKPMTAEALEVALGVLFASTTAPAMVVAVVRGDQVTVRGYGQLAPGDPRAPNGATLVRLESISKLFTGQVMANLAVQGRLAAADPLQRYAPADCKVPVVDAAKPITLTDLATHTSGLPRIAVIGDIRSPVAAANARWAWLRRQKGLPAPGDTALYSNIAFDLLADALADAAKEPYPAALKRWVTAPLGMVDTTAAPTPEQCHRMMAANPGGPPKPCRDDTATIGSGGLYSTAGDMALWMKQQLAGTDPAVRAAQTMQYQRANLAKAVGLDHAGPADGIGLGWIELTATADHPRLLEKTGGGDGFLTYIALAPDQRVGVFVAIDKTRLGPTHPLTGGVNALMGDLAVGVPVRPAPPVAPVAAPPPAAATAVR